MNLFWVVICLFLSAGLQALILGHLSLYRVTCRRSFTRRAVFAGDTLEMIEVLRNAKWLPVPWLRVESRISSDLQFGHTDDPQHSVSDQYHRSFFYLGMRQQVTRRHTVRCLRRGYYDVSSLSVTSGDLLGLITRSRTMALNLHLSVYPQLLSPRQLPTPATRWQGDLFVRRFINPDPFLYGGIREYQATDSLRDVHWRATASTGTLMVRQPDYTASPRAMILLNTQPSDTLWGEVSLSDQPLIEYGISMCASLALRALDSGVEAGLACNARFLAPTDPFVPPASGHAQRVRLLEYCARVEVSRALNFHTFVDGIARHFKGQDILVVSAYRDERMEASLARLKAMGNSVTFVRLAMPGSPDAAAMRVQG